MDAELFVWSGMRQVGRLAHDPATNRFAFSYEEGWQSSPRAFALSPQLPLVRDLSSTAESHSAQVRQFFENLLPEGEALDHAAQSAGTSRSNLVALLAAIGGETAGALRITADADPIMVQQSRREMTPAELSARIRTRSEMPFSVWDGKVRLSIAGYQDKVAVWGHDGKAYLVEGSSLASTVILKPAPARAQLRTLPANEHFCMRLAARMGLPVAATAIAYVPEPVLMVRRFDRQETNGQVQRLHIIDGCQALGVAVSMKYERAYGDNPVLIHLRDGVSLPRLLGLVAQSPVPAVDRLALLRWAICQVLIGNTDAHGKNISFFCDAGGLRVAPAYDLVCIAALDAGFGTTYAMAIGDAFTEQDLSPYEWAHFAYLCGLPFRLVARELNDLATLAIEQLALLQADFRPNPDERRAAKRVREEVERVSRKQLEFVERIATFKRTDFE